ncbi:hypothetical protein AK830_g6703 [Neonectria ditissima]|uniref:Uncharacterized protein n=1 Tax=Neonectria ditissima TaxID=78410 RepID=A0A0P7APY1_9HYPO|nr:hypothetical protein AK830_g6703 [Neonectria ditissima]
MEEDPIGYHEILKLIQYHQSRIGFLVQKLEGFHGNATIDPGASTNNVNDRASHSVLAGVGTRISQEGDNKASTNLLECPSEYCKATFPRPQELVRHFDRQCDEVCPGCFNNFELVSKYISHKCVESGNDQRSKRSEDFRRDIEAELGLTITKRKHNGEHSDKPRKRQRPPSGQGTMETAPQLPPEIETATQELSSAEKSLQPAPVVPGQLAVPATVDGASQHHMASYSLFDSVSGLQGSLGGPGLWWDLVNQWTETQSFSADTQMPHEATCQLAPASTSLENCADRT